MSPQANSFPATIDVADLRDSAWDAVVIGAGVAGAAAAILLSRAGLKTLLVEAQRFPREKVCGGCLNQRAQRSLERLGVLEELRQSGAVTLDRLNLRLSGTNVTWPMPGMLSVRRSTLDSLLVRTAIQAGARFISQAKAWLLVEGRGSTSSVRFVQLSCQQSTVTLSARCVLPADGLTRSSMRLHDGWEPKADPSSRIGIQMLAPQSDFDQWDCGRLCMAIGREGYVGLAAADAGVIDIAAAIDPSALGRSHRPADAIRQIVREAGLWELNLSHATEVRTTPALTRSSQYAADRQLFLVGDATGYVEPFTGEGMSWALASAEAVVPLVQETLEGWNDLYATRWTNWVKRQTIVRHRTCRLLSRSLRHPNLTAWIVFVFHWMPCLRRELMRRTSQ